MAARDREASSSRRGALASVRTAATAPDERHFLERPPPSRRRVAPTYGEGFSVFAKSGRARTRRRPRAMPARLFMYA